jgi:hypothetical protein
MQQKAICRFAARVSYKDGKCINQQEERDQNSTENRACTHSNQQLLGNIKAFDVKRQRTR